MVLLSLLVAGWSYAQTAVGTLTGSVTDRAGTPAAGVAVTATNAETGAKFDAITSQAGFYTIPLIPAGKYTVTAILLGFKTFRREDVIVSPSQVLKLDISLELGASERLITSALLRLNAARANALGRINPPVCSIPLLPMQQGQNTAPMPPVILPNDIDKGIVAAMPAPPCDSNPAGIGSLPAGPQNITPPTVVPAPAIPQR
jgi:hypothetical protein